MINLLSMDMRPLLSVLIPLLGAFFIFVTGEHIKPNAREGITITAAVLNAFVVYSMIPAVLAGEKVGTVIFELVRGVSFSFNVDAAGMVFACVAATLWILTSFYSIGYMRGHGEENQTGYYACFAMCITAAMGICYAANLVTFFLFFEMLTVATYPLVVHHSTLR